MNRSELRVIGGISIPQWAADSIAAVAWSLVIAVASQVAVPLPFTPVPITLQTLAVLGCGATLGSRRGTAAVLLYLAEGVAGLPVFSLGRAGIVHLLGPTGGYLAGFPLAAMAAGLMADRGLARSIVGSLLTLLAGTAVIYTAGLARLAVDAGWSRAAALGLLPFLPGEAVKLAAGVALVRAAPWARPWRAAGRS